MFKKCISPYTFLNYKRLLSFKKIDTLDWAKQEQILMEPFKYIEKLPNKYHKLMAPAFNVWLQISEKKINDIQEAMHTLMTWSIIIDDIQDSSAFRYGVPSADETYGIPLALNAANRGLLLGEKQIKDLGHPKASELLFKVHEEFFLGQGSDIHWRENCLCPTEEMHIDMVRKKCASWFALPIEIIQLFSSNKTNYYDLAMDIGTYYHLVDDYFNLFKPELLATLQEVQHEDHKNINDITESKLTLSIIHALQFTDVADELSDILSQRTSDLQLISRAITLLKKNGSDKYAKNKIKTMEADIHNQIAQFGGNEKVTEFMDDLALY